MTLARILENVQKKGKMPTSSSANDTANRNLPVDRQSSTYTYTNGERKIIDPVVARLKEARRLEREKKEREAREKKGLPAKQSPKKPKATIPLRQGPSKAKPAGASKANTQKNGTATPIVASRPKPTKMNFNDLMKKASSIDQSKLSISYKAKSKSPETDKRFKSPSKSRSPSAVASRPPPKASRPTNRAPRAMESDPRPTEKAPIQRAPLPTRGPSEKLAHKLKGKTKATNPAIRGSSREPNEYDEEEDDDLDSFIASDEEEDAYQQDDFDRDEIWAMFNRGKSRSHYQQYDDYDSDDMEATGAEIFAEENRSKRRAEIEDRKELEEEQRRAELKRQRKLNMRK